MTITIKASEKNYDIVMGKKNLSSLPKLFDFSSRKVIIVTEKNIPPLYECLKDRLHYDLLIIESGEKNKSYESYLTIMKELLEKNYSRQDVLIAIGGGVIGDLCAFVASTYKRGMKFINIPTSSLAMIDSSIGGKTAIDYLGYKNVIGTFYAPDLVLIDTEFLKTLPLRQRNNGLIEALKAGYIQDQELLSLFDQEEPDMEEIIYRSLLVKKYYVENDEKEQGIRKILNYGHTIGHALESYYGFSDQLLHGEAVANGMLYLSKDRDHLSSILKKLSIPLPIDYDEEKVISLIRNDKKSDGNLVDLIVVDDIAEPRIEKTDIDSLRDVLKGGKEYVRHLR